MRRSRVNNDGWGNKRHSGTNKTAARATTENFSGHSIKRGGVVHPKNRDKPDNRP